jgi:hypothetical protein
VRLEHKTINDISIGPLPVERVLRKYDSVLISMPISTQSELRDAAVAVSKRNPLSIARLKEDFTTKLFLSYLPRNGVKRQCFIYSSDIPLPESSTERLMRVLGVPSNVTVVSSCGSLACMKPAAVYFKELPSKFHYNSLPKTSLCGEGPILLRICITNDCDEIVGLT